MDTDTNTEYLTPAQIANLFNVSGMTIYRLIKDKKLRSVKVGGSYRIKKEWLDAYIDSNNNQ